MLCTAVRVVLNKKKKQLNRPTGYCWQDPAERNLAHELKALGYYTGFVGKWHCSSEIAMMHSPLRDRGRLYSWMQEQVAQ